QRMSERVLKSGEPVWIPAISRDPYFAALAEGVAAGIHSAYGFAISLQSEIAVVITLFSDAPVELDEAFAGTMYGVARHLHRFFERLGAEESQRALSVALMRAQDDERRRIARELHDSTGQYLSALALAIDAARSHEDGVPAGTVRKLEEANEIINRCSAELRTLSHLLHPPLLEELGLASAANWYVAGFADRSGVKIDAQIPAQMARFEATAELALFRTLQECLTNIHRHSGSKTASVKIEAAGNHLILEVRDQGKGIEREMLGGRVGGRKRPGVGITGMRERMKDLSGALEIESNNTGTTVRATIPVRERGSATSASENASPDTVDRRHVKSVGVSTVG
ncbi:MAG TPA: sensor histidine kinase, partial [Candidatus Acidoferrales bacterium]|nr:sensor histidine kinase [Candidatus Acidoferrales bacterium]